MVPPNTLIVNCRLDPEDYRDFLLNQIYSEDYKTLSRTYRRKALMRSLAMFPLYPLACVGLFWLLTESGVMYFDSWEFALIVGCLTGVIQLVFNADQTRFYKQQHKHLTEYGFDHSWPGFLGRLSVEFRPEGIEYRCRKQSSFFPWHSLIDVEHDSDWLLMTLSSGRMIMINGETIESTLQIDDIVRVIEHYWDAKTALKETAREFLEEHQLPCPECSYSMQGVASNACPECGRAITLAELKAATAKQ